MSIIDDYFHQPNQTNRKALLDACWCWADGAADCLVSAKPRPRPPGSLRALYCSGIACAVEEDLDDRLDRVMGTRPGGRGQTTQVYSQLTDGFFPGSTDAIERHAGFRSFVTALACYHALHRAESRQERKRPAKILERF